MAAAAAAAAAAKTQSNLDKSMNKIFYFLLFCCINCPLTPKYASIRLITK